MWWQIILYLSVSFAYASTHSAWKGNFEYYYEVRGRSLTGLHEVSSQYVGVECKTNLKIQPRSDEHLSAKISDVQCAQIHMTLRDGWRTHIADSELVWTSVPISSESFQINMEKGAIRGLTVPKAISNWEVNMIKGMVSQFQLKIVERPPSSDEFLIPFTVREDTVTGNTETFYKIMRMPDHIVQQEPNSHRLMEEKRNEDVYEVTKYKNYTNSVELPSYCYGFAELEQEFPTTNQMGDFLTRGSFSRALLTGNLDRFTIQNTFTVSEILVNPTLTDREKGSVYSIVNATLISVRQQNEKIEDVFDSFYLDNLVYSYANPFDISKKVQFPEKRLTRNYTATNMIFRKKRYLEESELEETNKKENLQLHEAPESPLLRFTWNKGQSVKQQIFVQKVKQFAQKIAEELQDYSVSLEEESIPKFTILTSLVRMMNANEIRTASDDLFNASRKENKQDSWKIYRDSVAQSGTGPALLTIQDWIQSGRIEGTEASMVLATMARAVRQPSIQYMKTYFELITNDKVLYSWPVNDTAILGFSNLVHKVYIDKKHLATQFPVDTFRKIRNEDGIELLNKTIIPYFSNKLHKAISQAETHKIHLYIRALGNIGDPQILIAFEPYLEGDKQASQFQRLLMVLAMDRLAEKFPEQARSALVRLFHNNADTEEVRVAAVYQIMRTKPTTELLQYMASYTHFDKQEHVVAAVKSSIERISHLQGPEFLEIIKAAEAARPLLTKKIYGAQFGGNYLHQYVIKKLKVKYKHIMDIIGSEDEFYPKGLIFSSYLNLAGLTKNLINVQAIVTSIKTLHHVFKQQTSSYSEKHQQQKRKHQQQVQHQWSSQKIAEILRLQPDEQEQMEGNLYYESGIIETMFPFDNNTIKIIMKELTKLETAMQNGKKINFLKISNDDEKIIAFPTEMGLPFLYTYDTPTMMRIQGHVKITADPRIIQNKLQMLELIQVNSDVNVTLTSKIQGRISFITPYDHQQYISGYSKHLHLHIPLKGKFELDMKKKQATAEFEKSSSKSPTVLFHYRTRPYVSQSDIIKLEVDTKQSNPNSCIIELNKRQVYENNFGHKSTGLVFRVDQEQPIIDVPKIKNLFNNHGVTAALEAAINSPAIQKSDITLSSISQEYSFHKCIINLSYRSSRQATTSRPQEIKEKHPEHSKWERWQSMSPQERQKDILRSISNGIENFKSEAVDVSVEFQGLENIKYTMLGAYVSSNIDPKSRFMLLFRKRSDRQGEKPYTAAMKIENVFAKTNEPNLEISMKNKPYIRSKMQMKFGASPETLSIIYTHLEFTRSEEREQFLRKQPMYEQCRSEMREGNNQLPACTNITMASNLLDRIHAKVQYRNIPLKLRHCLRSLYYASKYRYYPRAVYERQKGSGSNNELSLHARFDPDLKSVNISIITGGNQLEYDNIAVNDWMKQVVILHPMVHAGERVMAKLFGIDTYRPFCVVDKTKVSTFNNNTFPADISDQWTVMFQYLPKVPQFFEKPQLLTEQLKHQTENFAILVRTDSSRHGKDVKITINSPETKFEVLDITMTTRKEQGSNNARSKVTVNDRDIQINNNDSYDYQHGYVQIYTLPNGAIKAEIKDQFYIVYDGEAIKLSVSNGKFRDATRGICGQFTEEKVDDFLTADNCFVGDHHEFIKSFEVEGSEGQQIRQKLRSGKQVDCTRKSAPLYADLIISRNQQVRQEQRSQQCTSYQTQYVQQNGEVCFTTDAFPKCVHGCRPTNFIQSDVPVHCVHKSSVAQLWKTQIDKGSSPDFSTKSKNRIVSIKISQGCA